MALHVVLYQPEIPHNTGNVARTCAAVGAVLHLIHPLGFFLSDRHLRRAGMDYWPLVEVHEHSSWPAFRAEYPDLRLWLTSTRAGRRHVDVPFRDGDALVFGPESKGLPEELLRAYPEQAVRIPMVDGRRSLNLANAVAIAVYEAVRQIQPDWF